MKVRYVVLLFWILLMLLRLLRISSAMSVIFRFIDNSDLGKNISALAKKSKLNAGQDEIMKL